jgi:hypothetical protein
MFAKFLTWKFLLSLSCIAVLLIAGGYYYQQAKACHVGSEARTAVRVRGLSWDADSNGFAFYLGLSKEEGAIKAGRLNSKIYVDGLPDCYTITKSSPEFEIEFETDQPTFRLIVEGDGFPDTISQHNKVPKSGSDIDVARLLAPRAEGPGHTWPLPIVAKEMGYSSWSELMAGNNAVIRLLTYGSGEEGAPGFTNKVLVDAKSNKLNVYSFDMDKKISFLLAMDEENTGAYMIVIPFSPGDPPDKDILLKITDTVTEAKWNPPRPWKFDEATVSVRNGFATDIRLSPSADQ